VFKNLS